MMHGATRTSAIQLCTLIKTERTVKEQRNMLHFAFNFAPACGTNPLQFLQALFSKFSWARFLIRCVFFFKKIKTTQNHSKMFQKDNICKTMSGQILSAATHANTIFTSFYIIRFREGEKRYPTLKLSLQCSYCLFIIQI